jgi:hypothetical protein
MHAELRLLTVRINDDAWHVRHVHCIAAVLGKCLSQKLGVRFVA